MISEKTILFVVNSLRLSGAGKMVHYLAQLCARYYKKVYAVSFSQEELVSYNNNVDYSFLMPKSKSGALNRLRIIKLINRKIKEINPDICVAFVSDVAFSARVATLFRKDMVFVSAERGDPYTLPRIWKYLVSWAYRRSDYCFFQLEKASDFFGAKVKNKSFVIPNFFIPCSEFPPYRGIRRKTIVSAGRFVQEKGFDILIKAFKGIHERHPDYSLVIYGEGVLKDYYLQLVKKLSIEKYVSFPGYISRVAETVREDGMFVLPSRYEGIPNVLIEVMSLGVPTISSNCSPGGPAFLTNNGERGLLFPVDDITALEECIDKIICDEKLQAELSIKGVEVADLLEPTRIEKMWLSAFNVILSATV